MEPVEKDRMIDILQTRIGNQNQRIERLEEALRLWVKFYEKNESENADNDLFLAEEAMEETRNLLGDNI